MTAFSSLTVSTIDPTALGQIYTTAEVAQLLHVAQRTVQDWIRTRQLTAVRYGHSLLVRQADLEAFGQVLTRAPEPTAPAQDVTSALG